MIHFLNKIKVETGFIVFFSGKREEYFWPMISDFNDCFLLYQDNELGEGLLKSLNVFVCMGCRVSTV